MLFICLSYRSRSYNFHTRTKSGDPAKKLWAYFHLCTHKNRIVLASHRNFCSNAVKHHTCHLLRCTKRDNLCRSGKHTKSLFGIICFLFFYRKSLSASSHGKFLCSYNLIRAIVPDITSLFIPCDQIIVFIIP